MSHEINNNTVSPPQINGDQLKSPVQQKSVNELGHKWTALNALSFVAKKVAAVAVGVLVGVFTLNPFLGASAFKTLDKHLNPDSSTGQEKTAGKTDGKSQEILNNKSNGSVEEDSLENLKLSQNNNSALEKKKSSTDNLLDEWNKGFDKNEKLKQEGKSVKPESKPVDENVKKNNRVLIQKNKDWSPDGILRNEKLFSSMKDFNPTTKEVFDCFKDCESVRKKLLSEKEQKSISKETQKALNDIKSQYLDDKKDNTPVNVEGSREQVLKDFKAIKTPEQALEFIGKIKKMMGNLISPMIADFKQNNKLELNPKFKELIESAKKDSAGFCKSLDQKRVGGENKKMHGNFDEETVKNYKEFATNHPEEYTAHFIDLFRSNSEVAGALLWQTTKTFQEDSILSPLASKLTASELATLVKITIKEQVNKGTEKSDGLLRGNSVASKLLVQFSNLHLKNEIRQFFGEFMKGISSQEVENKKTKEIHDDELEKLKNFATDLLAKLETYSKEGSENLKFFKEICQYTQKTTDNNSEYAAGTGEKIGADLFFLRVVTPMFTIPYKAEAFDLKFTPAQQQNAVLLASILQKVKNGVPYDNSKASKYQQFNVWINDNKARIANINSNILS